VWILNKVSSHLVNFNIFNIKHIKLRKLKIKKQQHRILEFKILGLNISECRTLDYNNLLSKFYILDLYGPSFTFQHFILWSILISGFLSFCTIFVYQLDARDKRLNGCKFDRRRRELILEIYSVLIIDCILHI
jgi:hypothetical protein